MFQDPFNQRVEYLDDQADKQGLVVVSNRLPVTFGSDGSLGLSSGGLVTAMTPVLKRRGGTWLGWSGTEADVGRQLNRFSQNNPYQLQNVPLSQEEVQQYYYGFSNQVLWPLFHGLPEKCRFQEEYWQTYQAVNEKFARKVAEISEPNDYIWVQDYHLLCLAKELEKTGSNRKTGFYLHTPFPSPENFFKLPWREELLRALLKYSLIGFQTHWDLENFCRCLEYFDPGTSRTNKGSLASIHCGQSCFKAGVFPISIDFDEFSGLPDVRPRKHSPKNEEKQNKVQTILGVDRLDYSKGIPERLQALEKALLQYPELRERIRLVQVVVPSRESIEEYQQLKNEIEYLVGSINGRWSTMNWSPIQYMHGSLPRQKLVAAYRRADIALVTPLRDGMNLVAKEYCASKNDGNGVLILSEFAGSAIQLKEAAILVNPYDINNVADAISRAFHLPLSRRTKMMHQAREKIRQEDVHWWLDSYLEAALKTSAEPEEASQPFSMRPLKRKLFPAPARPSGKNLGYERKELFSA